MCNKMMIKKKNQKKSCRRYFPSKKGAIIFEYIKHTHTHARERERGSVCERERSIVLQRYIALMVTQYGITEQERGKMTKNFFDIWSTCRVSKCVIEI